MVNVWKTGVKFMVTRLSRDGLTMNLDFMESTPDGGTVRRSLKPIVANLIRFVLLLFTLVRRSVRGIRCRWNGGIELCKLWHECFDSLIVDYGRTKLNIYDGFISG